MHPTDADLARRESELPRLVLVLDSVDPALPLERIVFQSELASHSHFTSAFRREFGTTPSRSRARHQKETIP